MLCGISLSTYNVRTLYQVGKFDQLTRDASNIQSIDLIGIQEHRWKTPDEVAEHWSDNKEFLFIYTSAPADRVGGVGLLVRRKHTSAIRSAEKISDRILKVQFEANPMVAVLVVYAPTELASISTKDEFYKDLADAVNGIPTHSLVTILGDFNARIGKDSHRQQPQIVRQYLFHEETNNNGKRLVDLCCETQLRVAQSRFPQPSKRLWTWMHPQGSVYQLDHILIRSKWVRSVTNCRVYNSLELDSDHRVLSANLQIRFRANNIKKKKRPLYNWELLTNNVNKQNEFCLEISNRFQELQMPDHTDTEQHYDQITSTIKDAVEVTLGCKQKKPPKRWVSEATIKLTKKRNTAKRKYQQHKTPALRKKWRDLAQQVQASYAEDDQLHLSKQIEELKEAERLHAPKKTWKIIREISGVSMANPATKVKAPDGREIKSTQELLDERKKYFSILINAQPVQPSVPIPPASQDLPIP